MQQTRSKVWLSGGFTAVELLITLFVASIFLFAGYQLYTQVIRDGQEASNLAEASNITHTRLQDVAATAAAELPGSCDNEPTPTTTQSTIPGVGSVTYTTTILCPRGTAAAANLFLVKVRASYSLNGSPQSVEHAVYISSEAGTSAPIDYSDDFLTSGVLGNVKSGTPSLAWEFLNSISSNWSRNSGSGGYATSSVSASSNPMAVADVGKSNVSITEGVRSTGNAIYFRVVDSTNWLRARINMTSSTSSQTVTEYQQVHDCSNAGGPSSYSTWSTQTYPSHSYNGTTCQSTTTTGATRQNTYSTTNYYAFLVLDKSVGGTVTQLASTGVGSSPPQFINVTAKGSAITTSYGSTTSTTSNGASVTDTSHQSATKHGIGYAASSYSSPTGVSSISIKDAP